MNRAASAKVIDLLPIELTVMDTTLRMALEKESAEGFPTFAWSLIGDEANGALHDALNCDVLSLVAEGWCVARELHAYKDCGKHPAGERSVLFLGEHTLVSTAYPEIVVTVAGRSFKPVKLTLELQATFTAAALTIQDGYIKILSGGKCSASAQLKYGAVDLHEPLKSREVLIPGRHVFDPPGLLIQSSEETGLQSMKNHNPPDLAAFVAE